MNPKKINIANLPEFDMAEYLKTDEDIAHYLTLVLAENNTAELSHALGIIARVRGMTEVAKISMVSHVDIQGRAGYEIHS